MFFAIHTRAGIKLPLSCTIVALISSKFKYIVSTVLTDVSYLLRVSLTGCVLDRECIGWELSSCVMPFVEVRMLFINLTYIVYMDTLFQ